MSGEASRCGGYVERPCLLGKLSQALVLPGKVSQPLVLPGKVLQALTYDGGVLQGAVDFFVVFVFRPHSNWSHYKTEV